MKLFLYNLQRQTWRLIKLAHLLIAGMDDTSKICDHDHMTLGQGDVPSAYQVSQALSGSSSRQKVIQTSMVTGSHVNKDMMNIYRVTSECSRKYQH